MHCKDYLDKSIGFNNESYRKQLRRISPESANKIQKYLNPKLATLEALEILKSENLNRKSSDLMDVST